MPLPVDPSRGEAARVVVLVSGTGTNLQALLDAVHGREAVVVAVASDKPGATALERARAHDVPTAVFPLADQPDREARDAAIAEWLDEHGVQLVVLAGYMAILTAPFVRRHAGRLVNVHPSLLPAFPGIRAIAQALDHGVKVFGVTVHLVDAGMDTGPIIAQAAVELPGVQDPEAVRRALRPLEHDLLPAAVRAFAAGDVRVDPENPRRVLTG